MLKLFSFLSGQVRLQRQAKEITTLQKKVALLEQQNESMRQGMRRCVTCEYRIEAKQRNQ